MSEHRRVQHRAARRRAESASFPLRATVYVRIRPVRASVIRCSANAGAPPCPISSTSAPAPRRSARATRRTKPATHGRPWTREELALGFVGDVGDLAKLVQAMEGVRAIPDAKTKLAHELADCLWSLMTLADAYDVDLEQAFTGTMT